MLGAALTGAALLLVTTQMLELHGPEGQAVFIAERAISSLRAPSHTDLRRYFPKNTHCVVVTTNSKFIAVRETCPVIRDMMQGVKSNG